jgi:hypothetical protein
MTILIEKKCPRWAVKLAGLWILAVLVLSTTVPAVAQNPPATPSAVMPLGAGISSKKADEFLATLRPPTSVKALLIGNDLLLDIPDVAKAGQVRARVVSTISRTDGMWLLSLHAMPESGSALFAGMQFEVSALPDATLSLQLYKTQPVLLVARSAGKYYGLYREVKVGSNAAVGSAK